MKIKNGDVFLALNEVTDDQGTKIKSPLKQLIDIGFPIKTSYALAKMAQVLESQFKVISQVKDGLVGKYGQKDERGFVSINPSNKKWSSFIGEFEELLQTDVELDIEKVKLPEKIGDEEITIQPQILISLDKFIEV